MMMVVQDQCLVPTRSLGQLPCLIAFAGVLVDVPQSENQLVLLPAPKHSGAIVHDGMGRRNETMQRVQAHDMSVVVSDNLA